MAGLGAAGGRCGWKLRGREAGPAQIHARKGRRQAKSPQPPEKGSRKAVRRWVSERLGMGDESRVPQAIGRVKRDGPRELKRLKTRLEQVYKSINGETEI